MLREGMEFSIEAMIAPNGSVPLIEFLAEVKQANADDLSIIIANLKKVRGASGHRYPLMRTLTGSLRGVREIRCRVSTGAARILCVYRTGSVVLIMGGVIKKRDSFTKQQEKRIIKLKAMAEREDVRYEKIDFTIFEK